MIKLVIILIIVILIFIKLTYHINIDIPSFLRKGVNIYKGAYGTFCYSAKQGNGKTLSCIKFITHNYKNRKLYCNLQSYTGRPYTYIESLEDLLKIKDEHCIIFFDEIFTQVSKNSRLESDVLEFLAQMRKKENIFITTCQEWLELPITFRRFVRYHIKCKTVSLLGMGILIEQFEDAEQMTYDTLQAEYVAPIIATKISKYNDRDIKLYDTFEVIGTNKDTRKYNKKVGAHTVTQSA